MIGDYHLGDINSGFDYYTTLMHDHQNSQYYNPVFNINGQINQFDNNTHSADAITAYTINYLKTLVRE